LHRIFSFLLESVTFKRNPFMPLVFLALLCACLRATPQQLTPISTAPAIQKHLNLQSLPGDGSAAADQLCAKCHREKVQTFAETRHHLTSQLASRSSIAGHFESGKNALQTLNPQLTFKMDARDGRFYQTAVLNKPGHRTERREQIDIVIGSGRKGQSYLYWKLDQLFELPVSYWTSLDSWVNSPGYIDGSADFERSITPRCLECHATYFRETPMSGSKSHYDRLHFTLGISCVRCHGGAEEHARLHATETASSALSAVPAPPLGLHRDRQIDVCAQCHAGAGDSSKPAFSFVPGQRLTDYIEIRPPDPYARVDVHGNQVALLQRSRCYQSSPEMTCTTCHEVHAPEREAATYSSRCLACHKPTQCGAQSQLTPQRAADCIDCHMPVQSSNLLVLDADDTRIKARVRNHWIKVYSPKPFQHE
jgi:Cytochrome c554 and c-prime